MHTSSRRSLLHGLWMPLALFAGGLLAPTAHAQTTTPLAGTSIGNKASATYSDGTGISRSTDSNTVSTVVQPVPAVDIVDNRTVRAYPNAPIYFAHTITNTGNGADSFNLSVAQVSGLALQNLAIYADANGDGRPDSAQTITVTPTLQPGDSFGIVVAGRVPDNATSTQSGQVRVTAASATGASGASDSNLDTTVVSTNANVVLRKAVSANSGAPGGQTAGAATEYTYTLSYVNNSQVAAGTTVITDNFPGTRLKYVTDSAVWNQNNSPLDDADDGTDATVGGTTLDYKFVGNVLTATLSNVPAQSQGTITFKFIVPAGAAPGVVPNTANVSFDDDNDGNTTTTGTPSISDSSNTVNFSVTPQGSVTFTGETIPSLPAGGTGIFTNILKNNGTGTDTFDITLNQATSTPFPTGTTFQLFKLTDPNGTPADGLTPLLDTNNNAIPDTGPLAAGTIFKVVLRAVLPSGQAGGPFLVQKIATSSIPGTPTATADDRVTSVTTPSMNLTNLAPDGTTVLDANPSTGVAVVSASGAPGTTQRIPLHVINSQAVNTSDSFVLSVSTALGSQAALPQGYSVVFRDRASNQVITSVTNLPGGQFRDVYADVFIPTNARGGDTTPLYFTAASPISGASDTIYDEVKVSTLRSVSVKDPNSGQVFPGSSVTYSHLITNTGNVVETNVQVARSGDANGFSSTVYLDGSFDSSGNYTPGNGVLEQSEIDAGPLSTLPKILPGQTIDVLVKVFGPQDSSQVGRVNVTTLSATLDGDLSTTAFDSGGAFASIRDSTTLVVGDVKLDKFQSLDGTNFVRSNLGAKPGDTIYYRIIVTNTGTANVNSVVVSDFTPAYTLASNVIAATYSTNGATAQNAQVSPANGQKGGYRFDIGTLAPGVSTTINFAVTVQR